MGLDIDDVFGGANVRLVKNGPEDYSAYIEEFQYGSSTDRHGESIAEVLNETFKWLGINITVTMG